MKRATLAGVRISQGPVDWQVIQRRLNGCADIPLAGTWLDPDGRPGEVEARLVEENLGQPPASHLDWCAVASSPDHTWRHVFEGVPAGGPYRLETRLKIKDDNWRLAGDQIHHVGVGDLWLIAGDDNAVGFGGGMVDDPPEIGVHLFRRNETWTLASHPLHDTTGVRNSRFFTSGAVGHSPWLAFGRLIRRETGLPVGLLPVGQEGTSLDDWQAREEGEVTPALMSLLAFLKLASSYRDYSSFSLLDGGPLFLPHPDDPPGTVAGLVWFQGNADCRRLGTANRYAATLTRFLETLRGLLSAPELPVVLCQLNRVIGVSRASESVLWGRVREAQRAALYDIARVAVIPTLDAGLSDGIHNSASGNLLIGQRAARAALGLVYGKSLPWRSPDFLAASLLPGKRDQLWLDFSQVAGELRPVAAELAALSVADVDGGAPIRKIQLQPPHRLLVTLNRELGEKPVISFSASHNPPLALVDSNNCPPLAFHQVAVEEAED